MIVNFICDFELQYILKSPASSRPDIVLLVDIVYASLGWNLNRNINVNGSYLNSVS